MSSKTMQQDEYQYPGDEYVVAPQAAEQAAQAAEGEVPVASVNRKTGIQRFLSLNKRNVVMLGVLAIALVAFQVMHHQAPAPSLPPVQPAMTVATVAAPNDDQLLLQKSLADLEQSNYSNNQQIATLKSQLADVNTQLQNANQTNDQLKQAMVLLLQQLRDLNAQMAKKPAATVAKQPAHPEVVYAVRAMVDGRAWIQGSNGLSLSVTVGDPIPDYGNVTAIQAVQGMIQTTSGKVIRLGANDY